MFTHLRTHSYYSFLEGLPAPAQLAQAAADDGMAAMALTDRRFLTGAVEFYQACRAVGVKPILGLEIDTAPPAELPHAQAGVIALLAQDMDGWASLCRLSSALLTQPEHIQSGALPFDLLAENTAGLICLTGGYHGPLSQWSPQDQGGNAQVLLGHLNELFPQRLYVELQGHSPEIQTHSDWLWGLAQKMGLPPVASHSVYYLDAGQAHLQRTLTAMRLNCRLEETPSQKLAPPKAHFLTSTEMTELFAAKPDALQATQEITERCSLELPLGKAHFPRVNLPPGVTPDQALRERAWAGAEKRYTDITSQIGARLDYELGIIAERGYTPLFLIMAEITQYARQSDVPIASRGSAASSLVAYCLEITDPDPIRHNLYFERFLNPARRTPPDIDTDLCSRRRDLVIQHVYDTYGAERVAMVCTINRFRRRSALREVAKAHGMPPAEIKPMADALPWRGWGPPETGRSSAATPYAELEGRYNTPRHRAIFRDAVAILGAPRHLSIHPGGVVISPGLMTDLAPTQLSSKGVVISQFDLETIERLGLVKIDLLGIRGLTVLGDVADAVRERPPHIGKRRLAVLESIPEQDPATADLVRVGATIGCFQIESPGMRSTLKEIEASSIDDLMVALALYRPGPLTGGLKNAFVRRHLGQEPVSHLHPSLEPLLANTYGVILYQEQVLRIAHELAGLSLADADLLRRAMSHFDPGQQMETLKGRFIRGAEERKAVPPETAKMVWDLMAAFAGYGFPKAHAASYAQVSWRLAWCKAHHPAAFMAAVLANWGGYYPQRTYITEARRMELRLRAPHVNYSQPEFSVAHSNGEVVLFMGLSQVRDLTRRTLEGILRKRPFSSLQDFLARVDPRPLEAKNLVQVGAFDGLGTIPTLMRQLESGSWEAGQMPLFTYDVDPSEDWLPEERSAAQEKILGVSVEFHPLELVEEQIAEAGALNTLEAVAQIGQRVRVAGVRQTWRRFAFSREAPLYFMTIEDLEGILEVTIPSHVYRRGKNAISSSKPFIVEGVIETQHNRPEPVLRAERLWEIS